MEYDCKQIIRINCLVSLALLLLTWLDSEVVSANNSSLIPNTPGQILYMATCTRALFFSFYCDRVIKFILLFMCTFCTSFKISETLLLAESDFLHSTSCYNQGLSNLITEGHASVNNSVRHWNCSSTESANLILGVVKDIREEFQKVTHLIEKDYSGLHQFDLNWIHFTSAFSCVCLDNARMRGVDEGRPHSLPVCPASFFRALHV